MCETYFSFSNMFLFLYLFLILKTIIITSFSPSLSSLQTFPYAPLLAVFKVHGLWPFFS